MAYSFDEDVFKSQNILDRKEQMRNYSSIVRSVSCPTCKQPVHEPCVLIGLPKGQIAKEVHFDRLEKHLKKIDMDRKLESV